MATVTNPCSRCGTPTTDEFCDDCWLEAQAAPAPRCSHYHTITRDESTDDIEETVAILCLDCDQVLEHVSSRE